MLLRAASNIRCDSPGGTLELLGEEGAIEHLPDKTKISAESFKIMQPNPKLSINFSYLANSMVLKLSEGPVCP